MAKNLVSVQYVGRHPAVEVDLDGIGESTVVLGEVVKVPEDVAVALLEQPANWRIPEKAKSTPNAEEAK